MNENTHILRWTEWDGSVHTLTFPSAEAAAEMWRSMSQGTGLSFRTWFIEPQLGVSNEGK